MKEWRSVGKSLHLFVGAFRFCCEENGEWVTESSLQGVIGAFKLMIGDMFATPAEPSASLFALMDADGDGRASLEDFKRVALEDPEILQGFLLYDGVV